MAKILSELKDGLYFDLNVDSVIICQCYGFLKFSDTHLGYAGIVEIVVYQVVSALREFKFCIHKKKVVPELCIVSYLGFKIIVGVVFATTCDTSRIINETNHSVSNEIVAVGRPKNHAVTCIKKNAGYKRPYHWRVSRTFPVPRIKNLAQ